jgi:uncharacterized ferredoxin-like protein
MALFNETEIMEDGLLQVAREMIIAAKTAPKGRGIDNMVYAILKDADHIKRLSDKMIEMGEQYEQDAFIRNAKTILECKVIVLLGTKIKSLGLKKCSFCGFANCTEKDKHPEIPCAFNTGDLGIAVGSAVSVAMDRRVDNRIMYTIGQAALELKLFDEEVKVVYGIPLSVTSKNIFFSIK